MSSYGVSITVKYSETTSTGTITKETNYNFHVDTATNASDLISQTAKNAKEMNATVAKVEVTEENPYSYENPYRNLSDKEILELLLTK
jgi:cytoskeletal protein RodZ